MCHRGSVKPDGVKRSASGEKQSVGREPLRVMKKNAVSRKHDLVRSRRHALEGRARGEISQGWLGVGVRQSYAELGLARKG